MGSTIAVIGILCTAFWVGIWGYLRRSPSGEGAVRCVVGLALGAIAAHLGWITLNVQHVAAAGWQGWIAPTGFCVLFVPLGPLLVAPARSDSDRRLRFLAAAFGSLPLGIAVARIGCLVAGCCRGVSTAVPWATDVGGTAVHPTPAYEIGTLLILSWATARVPKGFIAPLVVAGLGLGRLVVEPWRETALLGAPVLPIEAVAGAMLVAGSVWAFRVWSARGPGASPDGGAPVALVVPPSRP